VGTGTSDCAGDRDCDGFLDGQDNCPDNADPSQAQSDFVPNAPGAVALWSSRRLPTRERVADGAPFFNRLLSIERRRMIENDMARRRKEIDELASRIRALPPQDQQAVVRQVLTPEMELGLVLDRLWKIPGNKDPRIIARAARAARREAEREHAARRKAERERARAAP